MNNRLTLRTNVTSLQAQRHHDGISHSLFRSTERLSSGLRINRAADDAAGQAISEKLATQVRGLGQAAANAQDAINLAQTADGALAETSSILQRMRELVVQAGNDTYTQSDRVKIQEELEQLKLELTRIAKTTQFNGRTLLDGSIAKSRFGFPDGAYLIDNPIIGEGGDVGRWVEDFNVFFINPVSIVEWSMTFTPGNPQGTLPILGFTLADNAGFSDASTTYNASHRDGTMNFTSQMASGWGVFINFSNVVAVTADIGKSFVLHLDPALGPQTLDRALQMQVGSGAGQTLRFAIQDMSTFGLRLENVTVVGGTEADSHARINVSLRGLDSALQRVNQERTTIGATQNRLAHALSNLGTSGEQQVTAQSRIKDADFAQEATKQTRSQVLQEATISLLAQANTLPEMALKLLESS